MLERTFDTNVRTKLVVRGIIGDVRVTSRPGQRVVIKAQADDSLLAHLRFSEDEEAITIEAKYEGENRVTAMEPEVFYPGITPFRKVAIWLKNFINHITLAKLTMPRKIIDPYAHVSATSKRYLATEEDSLLMSAKEVSIKSHLILGGLLINGLPAPVVDIEVPKGMPIEMIQVWQGSVKGVGGPLLLHSAALGSYDLSGLTGAEVSCSCMTSCMIRKSVGNLVAFVSDDSDLMAEGDFHMVSLTADGSGMVDMRSNCTKVEVEADNMSSVFLNGNIGELAMKLYGISQVKVQGKVQNVSEQQITGLAKANIMNAA